MRMLRVVQNCGRRFTLSRAMVSFVDNVRYKDNLFLIGLIISNEQSQYIHVYTRVGNNSAPVLI